MPYKTIAELPPPVRDNLPTAAEKIFLATYNSAWEQHKSEKGAEITCNSIAWAAVKKAYKKNDSGQWVAREANVETKVKEAMSDNDRREMLQAAVTDSLAIGGNSPGPWIKDVYDTEVVYEVNNKSYRMSYVIDRKGKVVLGQAERVVPMKVYSPMAESIEAKIDELTNLSSQREDTVEVRESLDNLLELLEKEDVDEEAAGPHLKKADELIARLQEAAPMKTEDGEQYPMSAFAYTPDSGKPSDWKLRLWEDPTKKITKGQLGRAAAALSPGGFRGNKVEIEKDSLPAVKRKIRSEYKKLGVEDEAIPKWVKEAESRELLADYTPLTEARIEKGEAKITVIKPGFNSSKTRFYPEETLARDYGIFEGAKMYADHPSSSDEKERPERSIRDWVGTLTSVRVSENGDVVGTAKIVEPWMQEKLAVLRDKDMLDQLGVSINAVGSASDAKIQGTKTKLVERFIRARSVDFVTEAGAGGGVALYEAATDTDIDLIDADELRSRRPDIVTLIETEARTQINQEVKAKMEVEAKVKELEDQVETLTTERDALKEAAAQAERDKAKAAAQAVIKEAVDKAKLPDAAKTRLLEAHKDDETGDGIEDVIKAEEAYIAAITETGKIKGLGPTKVSEADASKIEAELKEGFIALGMSEKEAETAVKGR